MWTSSKLPFECMSLESAHEAEPGKMWTSRYCWTVTLIILHHKQYAGACRATWSQRQRLPDVGQEVAFILRGLNVNIKACQEKQHQYKSCLVSVQGSWASILPVWDMLILNYKIHWNQIDSVSSRDVLPLRYSYSFSLTDSTWLYFIFILFPSG